MARYNNSYRIIYQPNGTGMAIGTIDKHEYELLKATKRQFPGFRAKFHGNGVVKTATVESYDVYKMVRRDYKERTQA